MNSRIFDHIRQRGGSMVQNDVYYRKWRPQSLNDLVGQDHIVATLKASLEQERIAHAYLFVGPRGTGKTSTARILAKAINCENNDGKGEPCNRCNICREIGEGSFIDLHEIDAASHRGVDDMRDLISKLPTMPNVARKKVYVIDEVHGLTNYAEEALLKTLEEPPQHVIFVLATTEEGSVRSTIASRCQKLHFRKIAQEDAVSRLAFIASQENLEVSDDILGVLVRAAEGSLRDASNFLENLVLSAGDNPSMEAAENLFGTYWSARAYSLLNLSADSNSLPEVLHKIGELYAEGVDMRQLQRELIVEARSLLLIKAGVGNTLGLTAEDLELRNRLSRKFDLQYISELLGKMVDVELKSGESPLKIELIFVEMSIGNVPSDVQNFEPEKLEPYVEDAALVDQKKGTNTYIKETDLVTNQISNKSEAVAPNREETAVNLMKDSQLASEPGIPQEKIDDQRVVIDSADLSIEDLQSRWKAIVDQFKGIGAGGNIDAFLRSVSVPIAINDQNIVIGFYHDFHKQKIEDPRYKPLVEKKLSEILGKHYSLECEKIDRKKSVGHLVKAAIDMGAEAVDEQSMRAILEGEDGNSE